METYTFKYSWVASSEDGSFEDKGTRWFTSKRDAYINMRAHALEKMQWNTQWEDLDDNGDSLGYKVHFAKDKIVHESYSGIYTYRLVEKMDTIIKYGVEWTILDSYEIDDENDYFVADFGDIGVLWMNNCVGCKILFKPKGTILFSYL